MSANTVVLLAAACVLMVAATQAQAVYVGSPMEGRVKRQAPTGGPGMFRELQGCCRIPMIIKPESRRGCFPAGATTPPPTPVSGPPKACGNHSCVIECAFRNQTLLNAAGTVDSTKLSARVAELAAADTTWGPILTAALATCTANGLPAASATAPCKSGAAEVTMCINNQLYQKCPASIKVTSERCNTLLAQVAARSG